MSTAKVVCKFADGTVQFDSSKNRLFRTLAVVSTGTTDGSQAVADLDQGTMVVVTGTADGLYLPQFSKSGGTVSWTFNGVHTSKRKATDAIIGVY